MQTQIGVPTAELQERRERLLEHARGLQLSGVVLFDADYIRYFTNFNFLATERPVAVAASTAGRPRSRSSRSSKSSAFAPRRSSSAIESYPEYPGKEHPLRILGRVLADAGIEGPVGADGDGYPGILGYQGPALSEVTGAGSSPLAPFVEQLMARKSEAEIELIRESGRWCSYAHRLLQEHTRPGATEAQASLRAGHDATLAMLDELGDVLRRPAGLLGRRLGGLPRPDRAPELLGARRGTQHRVPAPATSSSRRRAPRSGATTPSSSAR